MCKILDFSLIYGCRRALNNNVAKNTNQSRVLIEGHVEKEFGTDQGS